MSFQACGSFVGLRSSFVGLAGFEPAASATQNCYEPRTRMLALH
jgi:hypothetical protein